MAWGDELWNEFNWSSGGNSNPTGPAANRKTPAQVEQGALLGTDIQFKGDYSANSKGDYVLLSGIEALRQSIVHRLITKPGEFKVRPAYGVGIREWVKKPKTATNILALQNRITDQLSKETRIEQIISVRVESIDDGLKIALVIRAAGKTLRFQPFLFNELGERTLDV